MRAFNLGAVRRALYASAVLTLLSVPSLAQVVERGRTFADLTASHPCDTGLTNRIARVTDCDAADDIGDGEGAFQCWAICDGSAPWVAQAIGGGAGGAGVSGLDTADGGTALADNTIVRGDGTTGIQGSAVTIADTTGNLQWEGATADAFEGNFTFADPTADWTWAWDATGNVVIPGNVTGPSAGFTLFGGTSTTADLTFQTTTGIGATGADMHFLVGNNGATEAMTIFNSGQVSFLGVSGSNSRIEFVDSTVPHIDFINSSNVRQGYIGFTDGVMAISGDANDIDLTNSGGVRLTGRKSLAADFTNATTTMANLAGLSVTLNSGRKYSLEMVLFFSDSVAGEGAKFDFDGGAATATNFVSNCQMLDVALLLSAESTAIATDFAAATTTGASALKCSGSFEVNAAGTFIPRAAQNSHATGTLTVKRGSYVKVDWSSFN